MVVGTSPTRGRRDYRGWNGTWEDDTIDRFLRRHPFLQSADVWWSGLTSRFELQQSFEWCLVNCLPCHCYEPVGERISYVVVFCKSSLLSCIDSTLGLNFAWICFGRYPEVYLFSFVDSSGTFEGDPVNLIRSTARAKRAFLVTTYEGVRAHQARASLTNLIRPKTES